MNCPYVVKPDLQGRLCVPVADKTVMLSGTRMSASRVKEQLFESKDEAKQAFKKAKASTSGSMKNNDKDRRNSVGF